MTVRSEDKCDPARKKPNQGQEPAPDYLHECRVFKRWEESVHTYSLAKAKAFIALDDALNEGLLIEKHWKAHARKHARMTGDVDDTGFVEQYRRDLGVIRHARRWFFIYHMWDYKRETKPTTPGWTDAQWEERVDEEIARARAAVRREEKFIKETYE